LSSKGLIFLAAWEEENGESKEIPHLRTSKIILEYTDYASIQGLYYIFVENQTTFGRIFWTIVVFLMALLGTYWSISPTFY
jgi:hypothetical protein